MNKQRSIAMLIGAVLAMQAVPAFACFTTPAPSNVVTSIYGWRYHPVFHRWRLHKGIDFRAAQGTTLVAAQSGTIQTGYSSGGGNELRIIGSDGTVTRYLHLSKPLKSPGETVSAGDAVALSGNTGEASAAPHLHFEAYPGGKSVTNPEPLFCSTPTRKAGAESVNGFPILTCDPDNGQCDSAGGPPTTSSSGANTGSGNISDSVSVVGGVVTDAPPAPSVSSWDDMSTNEIFVTEVSKRFGNPDWYNNVSSMSTGGLVVEYLHMKALHTYILFYKGLAHERVEQMLAALLARQSKAEMSPRLDRQRAVAARANNQ